MFATTNLTMLGINYTTILMLVVVSPLVCFALLVIYRLTLHPLAGFPGPKLAAATGRYEFYYDCIKDGGGRYWIEIGRMHQKYGPIVRITPWELHISDSKWNDVYKLSARASKPRRYYRFLSGENTTTSITHEVHHMRRQAMLPYFSPTNVARNIPGVSATIDKFISRLSNSRGQVVNLNDGFRCLTTDVATGFGFGKSFGNIDEPSFEHEFNETIRNYGRVGAWNRCVFGIVTPLMQKLPAAISKRVSPAERVQWFMQMLAGIAKKSYTTSKVIKSDDSDIVQTILASNLPPEEKTLTRVINECRSVVLAGTETTATFFVFVTWQLLNNPEMLERLQEELDGAVQQKGRPLEYSELKELTYLTGIVNEGLRLAHLVTGRFPRMCPGSDLSYGNWRIPRGSIVSISPHDQHVDPTIFNDPERFDPERWLDPNERKRLGRYLQPFGRGSRICLGMELAYLDIYLTLSKLFASDCAFRLQLFDTTEDDWAPFHDFFTPFTKGRGLRVVIRPR